MFSRITSTLTQPFTQQATSFALAAMVTLSMLGGVDQLAQPEHEVVAQQGAVDTAAEQVVVITGKRISHSS